MTELRKVRPKETDADMPVARRLAEYVLALDAAALGSAVSDKVGLCLLDLVSCCASARALPWSRRAADWAEAQGARPDCTVVANALRTAAAEAAFANAVAGHGLIREDMHVASGCHIGVAVLPAALAIAEREGAGGAEFACAAAAGYEVMARLGRAVIGPRFVQTFRPTGVVGPVGAAVAAGRLLGLDEEGLSNAIGLAANFASGLNEWPRGGGEEIYLHAGMAARNGVLAAELAARGARASAEVIEGRSGMLAAYGADDAAVHDLLAGLGSPREILTVFHKPAPACNYVQTPAQAAAALVRRAGITGDDVDSVEIKSFPEAMAYPGCDHAGPFETLVQAKMSLQFGVAAVLVHGGLDAGGFERLDDPAVLRIAQRTALVADPGFADAYPGRQGAEIVVRCRDGRTESERRDDLAPLTGDEVRARYRAEAGAVLPDERVGRIEAMAAGLGRVDDMGELARLAGLDG